MKSLIDLDLSHQDLLTTHFRSLNLCISEYSFANAYLFRKVHRYELYLNKYLFLKGITRSGESYLMPTFPLNQIPLEEVEAYLAEVNFFFPLPEASLSHFSSNRFHLSFSEDESDYLYPIQQLKTYAGRYLSGKRNLVKQLLSSHRIHVTPLSNQNISDAKEVLYIWQENQELKAEETDFFPCQEALELLDNLNLSGKIFYVEDKPSAFLIGERLCQHNFTLHFSKANRLLKGLYQHIFQNLAQSLDDSFHFINMEQDLGLTAVRQSKLSYHPSHLLRKYRLERKRQI